MGKTHKPHNKSPTREEQREFAADKFRWLRQIALDPDLPPLASRFAILLAEFCFNIEYDGEGWAGQDWLAAKLGCRREAVNRLFALLVKHGHLTYKRGGWGDTNRYRMAFKEEVTNVRFFAHQEETIDDTDVRFSSHQEQVAEVTDVRKNAQSDVRKNAPHLLLTNSGAPTVPPGESTAAAAAGSGGPALSSLGPPRRKKKETPPRGAVGNDAAAVPRSPVFVAARAVMARGYESDATPQRLEVDEAAWDRAIARGMTPDAIHTAAASAGQSHP
jgi:hypothetical protein